MQKKVEERKRERKWKTVTSGNKKLRSKAFSIVTYDCQTRSRTNFFISVGIVTKFGLYIGMV